MNHAVDIASIVLARWGHGNFTLTGWGWLATWMAAGYGAGVVRSIFQRGSTR